MGPLRQPRRRGGGPRVAGIAAWRGYVWWEEKKAAETGAAFEVASSLAEAGKRSEAEAAFAKIAADGTSGYRQLARLRETAELAQTDPRPRSRPMTGSADGSVGPSCAILRCAPARLIDAGAFDEARQRLEPLAAEDRTFRHTAREFLVLAAWRAGDTAAAKRWSDMMMTDTQTPAATRSRVEMLMALGETGSKS